MRKKWIALALAGLLSIAPSLGLAETVAGFDPSPAQPLLDAVASAALGAEETIEHLTQDEALTEAFLSRLIQALKDCGVDADMDALSHLVAMPLPSPFDIGKDADGAAEVQRLTLRVLTIEASEDGDAVLLSGEVVDSDGEVLEGPRHAVIELHAAEDSPVGWKLYRFSCNDSALLEAVMTSYFAELTAEYVNTACGYSIQYPAFFSELITVRETGVQAALEDDSASFSVLRLDNADGLSLEEVLAQQQELVPGTETSIDEMMGCGVSVYNDETDITHVAIWLVSEQYIYHAELNYPGELEEEYAPYVQYMINSFSADEFGLG